MDSDARSSVAVLLILVTALFIAVLLVLLGLAIVLLLLLPVLLTLLSLLILLALLVLLLLPLLVLLRLLLVLLILLRSHYVHPIELLICAVEMRTSSDAYCMPGMSGRCISRQAPLIVEQKRKQIENLVSCIAKTLLSSWHLIHRRTALGVSVPTLPIPTHDAQVAVHTPQVLRSPCDVRLSEPAMPGGHDRLGTRRHPAVCHGTRAASA